MTLHLPTVKTATKAFSLRELSRLDLLHASPCSPLTKDYTPCATEQTPATFLATKQAPSPPQHWTTCLWTSTLSHHPISNIMRPSRHLAIATLHTRGPCSVDLVRHRLHNTDCKSFALFMLDSPCYLLNLLYIIIIRYYIKCFFDGVVEFPDLTVEENYEEVHFCLTAPMLIHWSCCISAVDIFPKANAKSI